MSTGFRKIFLQQKKEADKQGEKNMSLPLAFYQEP
jgi:hypothetical protein